MECKIMLSSFEGPMDLLLHLVKQSSISIFDISIEDITKQYMDYIHCMEEMNLNVASEYLVMAAELLEIKSSILLPKREVENEDSFEEDPREQLISRLLEYERYKNITHLFKEFEAERKHLFTREPADLGMYVEQDNTICEDFDMGALLKAMEAMFMRKELEKPLNTKVTNREYSVNERSVEIKGILRDKKKVAFQELFSEFTRDYFVVTFLSVLDLARKQELSIIQEDNFSQIFLEARM